MQETGTDPRLGHVKSWFVPLLGHSFGRVICQLRSRRFPHSFFFLLSRLSLWWRGQYPSSIKGRSVNTQVLWASSGRRQCVNKSAQPCLRKTSFMDAHVCILCKFCEILILFWFFYPFKTVMSIEDCITRRWARVSGPRQVLSQMIRLPSPHLV